jgi:hypothetical protein
LPGPPTPENEIGFRIVPLDRPAISSIRAEMSFLIDHLHLKRSRLTTSPAATKKIANDDRVLEAYHWACNAKSTHKLDPRLLTAYIIIFEEMLGLDCMDAVGAAKTIKDPDELAAYVQKIKTEKLSPP